MECERETEKRTIKWNKEKEEKGKTQLIKKP